MGKSVSIASDHGGYALKGAIIKALGEEFAIVDSGPFGPDSVDYTDYAREVAREVAAKSADFGVLICTSGIGMSIAANKVRGVRAALVCDLKRAELARRHNNANIICLGASFIDEASAIEAVRIFLSTKFDGDLEGGERHRRRVAKIEDIEK